MECFLSPTPRNAFFYHYKNKWIDDFPVDFKDVTYKRFVDVLVDVTFKSKCHAQKP